jgi:WhiB family redox-sensing transcriptional regulator
MGKIFPAFTHNPFFSSSFSQLGTLFSLSRFLIELFVVRRFFCASLRIFSIILCRLTGLTYFTRSHTPRLAKGHTMAIKNVMNDIGILDAVKKRPDWYKQANCKGAPTEMFFLERGCSQHESKPARALCNECTVQTECLQYALSKPEAEMHGIWGGTTGRERRLIRRQIHQIKRGGLKQGQKISVIDLIATSKQ